MQHINVAPKPPIFINPDISPALSAIILHCLEKNPRMRFPNATAMATALAEVLGPERKGLTLPASPKTNVRLPLQPSTSYGSAISSQLAASTSSVSNIPSRSLNSGSSPETGGIPGYAVQRQRAVTLMKLPHTPPPARTSVVGAGASMAGASPATTIPSIQSPQTPPSVPVPAPPASIFTPGSRKATNNINLLTKMLYTGILVVLIIVFVFSILGAYLVLTR